MWNAYLVLCNDGTLYCGISTNVEQRVWEHNHGKGAKYTKARLPVYLVWFSESLETRSEASKLEYKIKQLSRREKWDLIHERRRL